MGADVPVAVGEASVFAAEDCEEVPLLAVDTAGFEQPCADDEAWNKACELHASAAHAGVDEPAEHVEANETEREHENGYVERQQPQAQQANHVKFVFGCPDQGHAHQGINSTGCSHASALESRDDGFRRCGPEFGLFIECSQGIAIDVLRDKLFNQLGILFLQPCDELFMGLHTQLPEHVLGGPVQGGKINAGAKDGHDKEIKWKKTLPAEFAFDDQTAAPEEKHVPDEVYQGVVVESGREPFERVDAVAEFESPVCEGRVVENGVGENAARSVDNNQTDRTPGKMV